MTDVWRWANLFYGRDFYYCATMIERVLFRTYQTVASLKKGMLVMSGYLSKSACNGKRPVHLAARRHFSRPDLIAKLLRERHVSRFLVAPEGFGKTGLAMEYAEVVFSYEHVFWLNAASPCFLRDLDLGIIVSTLFSLDDQPFLVVMEDVPPLDAVRAPRLSAAIDRLLERGCEVLATCAPSCDVFSSLQQDRVKLNAGDLLLSDVELERARSSEDRDIRPVASLPATERVPALCWGKRGDESGFLAGIVKEELPADMLLAMATMLVLEEGSLSDLVAFGPCNADLAMLLSVDYPYTGVDQRCERFLATRFSASALAKALSPRLDALASRSRFSGRDALVAHWADDLVMRNSCERACDMVKLLCTRETRVAWLVAQSRALFKRGSITAPHELYLSLSKTKMPSNPHLELGEALRLLMVGDEVPAFGQIRRLAFDAGVPDGVRALSALTLFRRVRGEVRERALSELRRLAQVKAGEAIVCPVGLDDGFSEEESLWKPLVLAQLMMLSDLSSVVGKWDVWCVSGADEDALALIATWSFNAMAHGEGDYPEAERDTVRALANLERYVVDRIERLDGAPCDLFLVGAGLAMENLRECGMLSSGKPLSVAASLSLHHAEMEMFSQRSAYERATRARKERRVEYASTHPDAFMDGRFKCEQTDASKIAPLLTVNLFGGLDVRIGDDPIAPHLLRRQKVKTLLALLVLNRGREFPRDRLVQILWPESDMDTARKNFYSIWSQLRQALADPTGSCPYLVRHQNGCKLDDRLLETDLARFEVVCRMLLFGQAGIDGWGALYAEIDEAFADEVMPSEVNNGFVVEARKRCRAQLVDALVAASKRLVSMGSVQEGLWFARAALRRDQLREDAHMALMSAQIAACQRTAALETYFSCRRALATDLGIDPSPQIVELYRSIIEAEETFR